MTLSQYTVELCAGGIKTGISDPPSSADAVIQDPGGSLNVGGPSGGGGSTVETSTKAYQTSTSTQVYEASTAVVSSGDHGPEKSTTSQNEGYGLSKVDASTDASPPPPITSSAVGGGEETSVAVATGTSSGGWDGHHNHVWGQDPQHWRGHGGNWLGLNPSEPTASPSASKKTACMANAKRTAKTRVAGWEI